MKRRTALLMGLAAGPAFGAAPAYPSRAVRWIVPFGAGGPGDVIARTISLKLTPRWGQAVVVDNKPGGYTTIAAAEAVRLAPDGYSLFQPIDGTLTMNPFMFDKLPYAPEAFTLLTVLAALPILLIVNDQVPVRDLQGFIAHAKARPGELSYGFVTGSTQIGGHQFCEEAGIRLVPVPYKSSSDVARAVVGGEIAVAFDGPTAYLSGFLQSGKVRFLASLARKRFKVIAQVPMVTELGYSGLAGDIWHGLVGPANMAGDVQAKIVHDVQETLRDPEVVARLSELALEPMPLAGSEFAKLVQGDRSRLQPVIQKLGIKI